MTSDHLIEAIDHRPTRLSIAAVVVVTLAATAALVVAAGLVRRVLYGAAGAVLLAVVLGLLSRNRSRPVGAAVAAIAFPIIGLSLLAGTGYTVAAQLRSVVPVGSVFLVIGATVAVFGAVTSIRDVLDTETLTQCLETAMRTTAVVACSMTVVTLVRFSPIAARLADAVTAAVTALVAPTSAVPLASFLVVLIGGLYGTREAVRTLPVAELGGDRIDAERRSTVESIDRYLRVAVVPLVALALVTLLLELEQADPYAGLPAGLRSLLGAIAAFAPLRWPLVAAMVVSLGSLLAARLLRRTYRASPAERLTVVSPYLSGGVLVLVVVSAHETFLDALRGRIAARLPAQLTPTFHEMATDVIDFYGGPLVALVVLTVLFLLSVFLVLGLLAAVATGLLSRRAGGVSLAAAGLFTAAAFAATLGLSVELIVAGLLAGVFVWDVGEFGVTLGRELGTEAHTARVEVVHGGGTLLVGIGTVLLVLVSRGTAMGLDVQGVPILPALVVTLIGLLLLVVASR